MRNGAEKVKTFFQFFGDLNGFSAAEQTQITKTTEAVDGDKNHVLRIVKTSNPTQIRQIT